MSCVICLSCTCSSCISEPLDGVYVHRRCRQYFHSTCMTTWLRQPNARQQCPYCRGNVTDFHEDDPCQAHPLLRGILQTYFEEVRVTNWVRRHLLPPDPFRPTSVFASRDELERNEIPFRVLLSLSNAEMYFPSLTPVMVVLDQLEAKGVGYTWVYDVEYEKAIHRETLFSVSRYLMRHLPPPRHPTAPQPPPVPSPSPRPTTPPPPPVPSPSTTATENEEQGPSFTQVRRMIRTLQMELNRGVRRSSRRGRGTRGATSGGVGRRTG